jgi:hypothetical protein
VQGAIMENDKQEEHKPVVEEKEKTPEELLWEEQLKKRLEELRKRDPFIYR